MLLTCKEATRLVSQGLDRQLGPAERLTLRLHLLICDGCSNFSKQLAFIRRTRAHLAER